jgi:hypothetical protein
MQPSLVLVSDCNLRRQPNGLWVRLTIELVGLNLADF